MINASASARLSWGTSLGILSPELDSINISERNFFLTVIEAADTHSHC